MPIIRTDKMLRPRDPNDFYPTPTGLILAIYENELSIGEHKSVLDPGMGNGVWGEMYREFYKDMKINKKTFIAGIDIIPTQNTHYNQCITDDFITGDYIFDVPEFNLVVGNPPYRSAEAFVRKGLHFLSKYGKMIYLLRLGFLASQSRGKDLWKHYPPNRVYVSSRRPSFTGDMKTDATEYAVYVWDRSERAGETNLMWLDWDYTDYDTWGMKNGRE